MVELEAQSSEDRAVSLQAQLDSMFAGCDGDLGKTVTAASLLIEEVRPASYPRLPRL